MNESTPLPTTKPNHSLAIVSLVLGILGLAAILPVIGSIGAVISGRIARREIAENANQYSGDNLARAGVTLGWIGIGLSVIVLIALCAGVLFFMPSQIRTTN
ncbi:DUF4190 domain-containing protein [bacterium]|nr:DUF4190 domain-containing protein [bacterium]